MICAVPPLCSLLKNEINRNIEEVKLRRFKQRNDHKTHNYNDNFCPSSRVRRNINPTLINNTVSQTTKIRLNENQTWIA